MRRREFIAAIGGAAAWSVAASGQSPRLPIIGFLGANTAETQTQWTAAFVQRLRELGWVEGQNIVILYRWAEGSAERVATIAAELVKQKPDVIVTSGGAMVAAAKRATALTPIVFAVAADPVGDKLVASLARPGGNVTGLSVQYTDVASKRLEILREIVNPLGRLAILANSGAPGAMLELRAAQDAAQAVRVDTLVFKIRTGEEIIGALEAIKGRAEALYVCSDPLIGTHRRRLNELALAAGLPTVHSFREHVDVGALISYGASFPSMFRRAGDYVDRILRGTKPEDLPVEQPTRFELVINLKTAKALGLTVPPTLLARADEVIE